MHRKKVSHRNSVSSDHVYICGESANINLNQSHEKTRISYGASSTVTNLRGLASQRYYGVGKTT
jgi:hypothetical protein